MTNIYIFENISSMALNDVTKNLLFYSNKYDEENQITVFKKKTEKIYL